MERFLKNYSGPSKPKVTENTKETLAKTKSEPWCHISNLDTLRVYVTEDSALPRGRLEEKVGRGKLEPN